MAAWLAGVVLTVLVVADIVTHEEAVAFAPLFALSPLIACAALTPVETGGFAVAAIALSAGAARWNGQDESVQDLIRVIDVSVMSLAAVIVAVVRVRQERRTKRLTVVAEVAQRAVLPVVPTHARRTKVAVRYQSATQDTVIGGDLYDCYHSRTHTRFLIGDVRGKGIEAVEQAARVIRAFRQAAAIEPDLPAVAADMSTYVTPFFDPEEFVTALLLDTTEATRARIVSAGHPQPLLVHPDGSCSFVEADPNMPLGIGDSYVQHQFEWQPGDRLLLYTDGVSEARDARGTFLDVHDLAPLVAEGTLDEALGRVLERVTQHSVHGELSDDVAMILLEHTATGRIDPPMAHEHDWLALLQR